MSAKFNKAHIQALAGYSIQLARDFFGEGISFHKWSIYKFHLFGDILEKWFTDFDRDFKAFQPDTGSTNLYRMISNDRHNNQSQNLLVICSNEVGDLIFEPILGYINLSDDAKIDFYTRNYYIAQPFNGNLLEYQTVHGSADDIKNLNKVMPYAVLRIVADIAENNFEIKGIKSFLETVIGIAKRKRLNTTSLIMEEIYTQLKRFKNEK